MGRNTRNDLLVSRRFAPCHMLAGFRGDISGITPSTYVQLIRQYQITKANSQAGKIGHENHTRSIKALREYLAALDHLIQHE